MKRIHYLLFAGAVVLAAPSQAQQNPRAPIGSLARSSPSASSGTYTASSVAMIESRARALGNRMSASGTRYFAVTDADLIGKTPGEVADRLSPPVIRTGDGLRRVEIAVDLKRPIAIAATPDRPANVGTAVIESPAAGSITVNSVIAAAQLNVASERKE